nr:2109_t:CDS:2 [Entrophospora candida]
MSSVTGDPSLITVAITPKYFMVEEEVEQRNSTLISIVGSILGYYRIDLISPWGFVNSGRCGFRKLKKKTNESLLLVMKDDDIEKRENFLELSQRVRHLEKFEFFLKDYPLK